MTDARFDELHRYYANVGKTFDAKSVWSIYEIPDLMKRAYCGKFHLSYPYHSNLKSEPLPEDPTWYDIWRAADKMIRLSEDRDHIFIESVRYVGSGVLEFVTGS